MSQKILKVILALIGTLIALALVSVGALAVWVMTGPKSLSKLTPYIETSLNPENVPYHVGVGDVVIFWESWDEPLDFRLREVAISKKGTEAQELLRLPEVSIGLDLPSLYRLKIVPKTVELRNPFVRVFRGEDGQFYLGFGELQSQRIPLAVLLAGTENSGAANASTAAIAGSIEYIQIRNARLLLGTEGGKNVFDAPDANLKIMRENKAIKAMLDLSMQYGESTSQLNAEVLLANQHDMVTAKAELVNFSPTVLAKLFPNQPEWAAMDMPFSGWADVIVDSDGNLSTVDFNLEGGPGKFTYEKDFAEPIAIRHARVEGQLSDNLSLVTIKKADLDFFGATLNVNGALNHAEKGWAFDLAAEAKNMPVNDLYKYWPKTLSPVPYAWVTTNIREGTVPHATARFKVTQEELGQHLPEHALEANIHAEGVTVSYLPGHPKVEDVTGDVRFTGKAMYIHSEKGKMLTGSLLKRADLSIPDLTLVHSPMKIDLEITAPATDIATYVSIPDLDYAKSLGLDPVTNTGNANGTLSFDFVLPSHAPGANNDNLKLDFLIHANLENMAQPGFMGSMNLSGANGVLEITPQQLTYNGTIALENEPMEVALTHFFKAEPEYTQYQVKGALPVERLSIFDVPKWGFLSGGVGFIADIKRTGESNVLHINANLQNVGVDFADLGFTKPVGKPATMLLDIDTDSEAMTVKAFHAKGEEFDATGSASVKENMQKLEQLRFDHLEFGDNNLALTVETMGDGYRVRAKGPSLDLKPFFDDTKDKVGHPPFHLPFALDFHGELDWVVIGKERSLRNVNAQLNCKTDWCMSANVRGVTGRDSKFVYEISNKAGKRTAYFQAADAGGFLRAMDIYDTMHGGTLTMGGTFDDSLPDRPFNGEIEITEHTITNAPTLTKMASLMSLTGIADTLNGKGITFNLLTADLSLTNTAIRVQNGKTVGAALGITVEDLVLNRATDELQAVGTVVPSYTLNTVLGNIPILGAALSGGAGAGMFAANYKITGIYPKTDVSVNPLSILAPGFLRNLVGGVGKVDAPQDPIPVGPPAPSAGLMDAIPAPTAAKQQ